MDFLGIPLRTNPELDRDTFAILYHGPERHSIRDRCCTIINGLPFFYTVTDLRPCDLVPDFRPDLHPDKPA